MVDRQLPSDFGPTGTSSHSEGSDTKAEGVLPGSHKFKEYLGFPLRNPHSDRKGDFILDWIQKTPQTVPLTKYEKGKYVNHSMGELNDSYSTIMTNNKRMTRIDVLETPISKTSKAESSAWDMFSSPEVPDDCSHEQSTAYPHIRLPSLRTSSLPEALPSIYAIGQKEPQPTDADVPASGRLNTGVVNSGTLDSNYRLMRSLNPLTYPPLEHKILENSFTPMDPDDIAFDSSLEFSTTKDYEWIFLPRDDMYDQEPLDFSPSYGSLELLSDSDASLERVEILEYAKDHNMNARDHILYQKATTSSDGLYHCPWEGKDVSCTHKPGKLKCNYDKFVDSHLKPYRCKVHTCGNARFSSTACLLRHEREAHAMHGHGEKPYLCTFSGCERGLPGNGFPRHWLVRDHMRRVHDTEPSASFSNKPAKPTRKRKSDAVEGGQQAASAISPSTGN